MLANYKNIDEPLNYERIEEYIEAKRLKMAVQISLFFIAVFSILTITFFYDDLSSLLGYIAALVIAVVALIYTLILKKAKPIFAIYGIAGSIISLLSCIFILKGTHYVDFIWIIVCTFVVYIGGYKKLGFALLCFNTLGIGFFIYFRHNLHVTELSPSTNLQLTGIYLEILLSLFVLAYLLYQFVDFQKQKDNHIAETNRSLLEQNRIIEKQFNENTTLLKEIHHRVKNNLQIIVSLLRLQKNELNTDEARNQFQEAINRILVMSSIHQKLYQQESLIEINLAQYLNDLVTELKTLFNKPEPIQVSILVDFDTLNLKSTVPIGLIINELLSNSLKYAFLTKKDGRIDIQLYKTESGFNLDYKDNGLWKEGKDKKGFGLEMIDVFTNQLNGKCTFDTGKFGTHYVFELEFAT